MSMAADAPDMMNEGGAALEWLVQAPALKNLLDQFTAAELGDLAQRVLSERDIDEASRKDWWERAEAAIRAGNLEREEKTYPWAGASNVKFPLITTAALRFNAQAYPAVCPDGRMVKAAVNGADRGGGKAARAERVAEHMSYQLRVEVDGWEEQTDRLTMQLPLVGTMWRKVWWDEAKGRQCVRLLPPGGLIVNDAVPSLEAAPRLTEPLELYPDEVEARMRSGVFVRGDWQDKDGENDDSLAPVKFVEQHRREDLDGDGYPEPYVVTVHEASGAIVRIAANWRPDDVALDDETGQVLEIRPREWFTDYHFIPSPNGGYHSIGFGVLLGDISGAIDSTINLIADAAHMDMLGSGFIGAEARLPGGRMSWKPGEYKQVKALGGDLRGAIIERSMSGSSAVLFSLLGLLTDAARELANVQDIESGAQRSNMPATTTLALIEQGQMVNRAIFKRLFRSLAREFAMMAELNKDYLSPQVYQAFLDQPADPRADYDLSDMDIEPVADIAAITSQQKLAKAQLVMDLAQGGMADPAEALDRILQAASIPDAEALAPKPDPQAQEAAQQMMFAQRAMADLSVIKLSLELAELEAKIAKTHAETAKTMAQAETEDEMRPVEAALAQARRLREEVNARIADYGRTAGGVAGQPGDGSGVVGPSPMGGGGMQGGGSRGMVRLAGDLPGVSGAPQQGAGLPGGGGLPQ